MINYNVRPMFFPLMFFKFDTRKTFVKVLHIKKFITSIIGWWIRIWTVLELSTDSIWFFPYPLNFVLICAYLDGIRQYYELCEVVNMIQFIPFYLRQFFHKSQ